MRQETYEEKFNFYQWSRTAAEKLAEEALKIAEKQNLDEADKINMQRLIEYACRHEAQGDMLKFEMAQMCRESGFKDAQEVIEYIRRGVQ